MTVSSPPSVSVFRFADNCQSFAPGQAIFEEGQPGNLMYVVQEGSVDVVVRGKVVDTVGPGGIVGEMALIDQQPRSATAIAKTECKLVPVDEQRFKHLVQQTPFFAIEVMRVMAHRLRRMDAKS